MHVDPSPQMNDKEDRDCTAGLIASLRRGTKPCPALGSLLSRTSSVCHGYVGRLYLPNGETKSRPRGKGERNFAGSDWAEWLLQDLRPPSLRMKHGTNPDCRRRISALLSFSSKSKHGWKPRTRFSRGFRHPRCLRQYVRVHLLATLYVVLLKHRY
jgi:hypothetical protein